jgi:hypothetical protein
MIGMEDGKLLDWVMAEYWTDGRQNIRLKDGRTLGCRTAQYQT